MVNVLHTRIQSVSPPKMENTASIQPKDGYNCSEYAHSRHRKGLAQVNHPMYVMTTLDRSNHQFPGLSQSGGLAQVCVQLFLGLI